MGAETSVPRKRSMAVHSSPTVEATQCPRWMDGRVRCDPWCGGIMMDRQGARANAHHSMTSPEPTAKRQAWSHRATGGMKAFTPKVQTRNRKFGFGLSPLVCPSLSTSVPAFPPLPTQSLHPFPAADAVHPGVPPHGPLPQEATGGCDG